MSIEDELKEIRTQLQELKDREAIRELIYYKARATDRTDPAAERRAFTKVPYADREGPADLVGDAEGRAALIDKVLLSTHHQIGNIIIDLRGDEAFTEAYCTAYHRTRATPESNDFILGQGHLESLGGEQREYDIIAGLRYLEHFRKENGKWQIVERRLVYDWTMSGIANHLSDEGLYTNSNLRGARKPDDPSYQPYAIGYKDL